MGGGDLNLKKSWHPSTLKNQERVWKAEQAKAAEDRKIAEFQRELKEEREKEALKKSMKGGNSSSKDSNKLEWMYKGAAGHVSREDYLLGRKIDASLDILNQEERAAQEAASQNASQQPKSSHVIEYDIVPECIAKKRPEDYDPTATVIQVDMKRKLMEDPLLAIRKREELTKREITSNPVKRKQIEMLIKCIQNTESSTDSSSSADSSKKKKKKNKKKSKKHSKKKKTKKKKKVESSSESESSSDSEEETERSRGRQKRRSSSKEEKSTSKRRKRGNSGEERNYDRFRDERNYDRNRDERNYDRNRDERNFDRSKDERNYDRNRDERNYDRNRDERNYDRNRDERNYDRNRDERNYDKNRDERNYDRNRDERSNNNSRDRSGISIDKQEQRKSKMSEKDMQKLREDMMKAAVMRDEERKMNVKRYAEEKKLEEKMEENSDSFVREHLGNITSNTSMEERVRSRVKNSQRGADASFSRR